MNAKNILRNRIDVAKKLISRETFSLDVYKKYFEIPERIAIQDLASIGFDRNDLPKIESKNPVPLSLLVGKRDQILSKSNNLEKDMEYLGFWYNPSEKNGNNDSSLQAYGISAYSLIRKDIIDFYQSETGREYTSFKNLSERFNLSERELHDLKNGIEFFNIKKYSEKILDERKDELERILKDSTVDDTSKVTGIEKSKLYPIGRALSEKYISQKSNLLVEHIPSKFAYQKETLMKKVWDMYNEHGSTHGRTQQEIAKELGLTRETVSHYITAYKKQHPEAIDVTQLYQPHHLGKEKTEKRNARKAMVASAYSGGMNIEQISKTYGIRREMVSKYLKEDGFIVAHANTSKNLEKLDASSKEAKVAFEEKGQFGSFKLNVEGNITQFHGATSRLLDEAGAPAYTTNTAERNKIRDNILQNQRDTMAMLRNNPEALDEFVKTNGEARAIISAQELVARKKELERKELLQLRDDYETEDDFALEM